MQLLLFVLGLALARGDTIRGLNPDLANFFTGTGGTFSCVSGVAKTIPFARVNDDYCDCSDGSDEPGTSACHNGRFYCRNLGHEPRLLAAAFVDDGVCDCCDGADEAKGVCKNTCLQASAVHKEALKARITEFEEALSTKAEYISKAATFRADLHVKSGSIESDVAGQQGEVARLKAEVDRLEQEDAARKAEEDALRAAEQATEQEAGVEQAGEEQAGEEQAGEEQAAGGDSHEELGGADGHEQRELQEEGEQPQPEEHEETSEEMGRRIASQWTHDPESATPAPQGGVDGEEQQEELEEEGEPGTPGDYVQQHHQEGEYDHGEWQEPAPDTATPLGAAKAALLEAESALRRLEKDQQDIQTFLHGNLDFGPDDIFLAFADRCFTSTQTRWTYEICFFKDAIQREGYTNTVTVGRWRGFSPDYRQILYGGGDECWNVGPRTMTVSMSCGTEEALSDGEEPGTCAYHAKFTSPALCDDSEVAALRRQLQNLEAFELEVQALIAKDEL